MTHGLSAATEGFGGKLLAKQSADEWYQEYQRGTIRAQDVRYLLYDWQNERVELLKKIDDLQELVDASNRMDR